MSDQGPDARWDTSQPDGWAEAVKSWTWHDWKEGSAVLGWQKYGECPRCEHTMSVYQKLVKALLPVTTDSVDAFCNCEYSHDGRPSDRPGGCGVGAINPIEIPAK